MKRILVTSLCLAVAFFSSISHANECGFKGDINDDGKIGLEEAIYALQTVSGIISKNLSGIFYNIECRSGGNVTLTDTVFQADRVSAFMNFTQRPEEPRVLCGAGNLNGTKNDNRINATFISEDTDPGCGFDHNSIFTITGSAEPDTLHFWGDYSPKNANGSTINEGAGVFEFWQDGQKPESLSFSGTFLNTNVNQGGNVTLDISVGTYTVSGYMNFTNLPGQGALCGAGYFTGVVYPDKTMQFSFISDDKDSGCGFDKGDRFIIDAFLSEDLKISGTYKIDTTLLGNFTVNQSNKLDK